MDHDPASLFFYGTLCHRPLLEAILGHDRARTSPATLSGWRTVTAGGAEFPVLLPEAGAEARGLLVEGLDGTDRARLDFYELGYGYRHVPVTVSTAQGPRQALAYVAPEGAYPRGPDWNLTAWAPVWGDIVTETAHECMGWFGRISAEDLVAPYATMLVRAASRLRARADAAPATLRRSGGGAETVVSALRRPYLGYFMVEEQDLSIPRFDGGSSPVVTRAAFVTGDAVTVLPWDPVRDRVLLVEQFRFAPHVRGDGHPFSLEAVAGRVDPGETPEVAARREAMEEAGLALGRMVRAASYYPSPGAVTEHLTSFVAQADLPDSAGGLGGLEHEAEDIRAHVIPFERLMALVASGEVGNGPLILTALWLRAERDRLKAEWSVSV
jgi:nudix-type nucleoside diphosphatase (YffH/AdpP family)